MIRKPAVSISQRQLEIAAKSFYSWTRLVGRGFLEPS
jgi:hypothetical protein